MEINFYKLYILNNDYILADFRAVSDNPDTNNKLLSKIALAVCDRHSGAGADGIIFIIKSSNDAVVLKTLSKDGTFSESVITPCIIASRYIFDRISFDSKVIKILNNGTMVTVQIIDSMNFRVSVGYPVINENITESILINDSLYNFTQVKLINTGMVFFPEKKAVRALQKLSEKIRKAPEHSGKLPLFVYPLSRSSINVKTWAHIKHHDYIVMCAIASVAAALNGHDNESLVTFNNNAVFVEWDRKNNEVFISSKPEYIYMGNYYFDDNSG